ncbi:MAG TPA: hypothetical protein VD763_14200 [Candidatus Saccharimonadales bacterium]|nr:hypothetical protein [Candidatus Saccharimonadales bacterium]
MSERAASLSAVPRRKGPPDAPPTRQPSALRAAAVDVYYQSIRLVPANLLWGVVFLAILGALLLGMSLLLVVLVPLLGVVHVGLLRLATLIVRGQDLVLSDVATGIRQSGGAAALVSVGLLGVMAFLGADAWIGFTTGGPLGWGLATLACWGLAYAWAWALIVGPLLADPARAGESLRSRLRTATAVTMIAPGATVRLALVSGVLLAVSTVFLAALLMISVAFIAVYASRVVLPVADAYEGRTTAAART